MQHLAQCLTKEEGGPSWKGTVTLMCDGAAYQSNDDAIRYMRALGFNVAISAPYAYSSQVCEYGFAFIKSLDLNPLMRPTGKK